MNSKVVIRPMGYLYIMLSFSQAFYLLQDKLSLLYDRAEASTIAHEVLNQITGFGKTDRLMRKDHLLSQQQQERYDDMTAQLQRNVPLQYVLGIAWFMGREYLVNASVLIPRPETEELVQWIIDEYKEREISILDIGTGSGCIPVSLKLALPDAAVTSCDISAEALLVAKENAKKLTAVVQFRQVDFLNPEQWNTFGCYDVIVSNPPYIPQNEKESLHANVKDHEPALALFVPDNDPLLFYRNIAAFGQHHLSPLGQIYCELHADMGMQTAQVFHQYGYKDVIVRKDMHGNTRMLRAQK